MVVNPESSLEVGPNEWFPIFAGLETQPVRISPLGERSRGLVTRVRSFGYGEVVVNERKAFSLPMVYFDGVGVSVYEHNFFDPQKAEELFNRGLVSINSIRDPETKFSRASLSLHLKFGQENLVVVHDIGNHWKDTARDTKHLNGFWTIAALNRADVLEQIQGLYGDLHI